MSDSNRRGTTYGVRIAFERIAKEAVSCSETIVCWWLPDGRRRGSEWVARNPRRYDCRPGSFKVNLRTGRWADFATDASGSDLISLAAYVFCMTQGEAAERLAEMLGIDPYDK